MLRRKQFKEKRQININTQTMSKRRKLISDPIIDFSQMRESDYNYFFGQQICSMRNVEMQEYYQSSSDKKACLQILFDVGVVLEEMGIVRKNAFGKYRLNRYFADYGDWKCYRNIVEQNCEFLKQHGHPKYIDKDSD